VTYGDVKASGFTYADRWVEYKCVGGVWDPEGVLQLIASLLALAGSVIQMHEQLGRLSQADPAGYSAFEIVEGWKTELAILRHPIRWVSHQLTIAKLLKESPEEAHDYRRANRAVLSWLFIVLAALISTGSTGWTWALSLVRG